MRFYIVLSFLWIYTAFKFTELFPAHGVAAIVASLLLFGLMISGILVYASRPHLVHQNWFWVVSWLSSFFMGWWTTFILFAVPFDLFRVGYSFAGSGFHASPGLRILLWMSLVTSFLGLWRAMSGPFLKRVPIPVAQLHPALNGLKIVQISDLHIGPTIRSAYLERMVKRINQTNADLVVVTGDLADAEAIHIEKYLDILADIQARHGIFYVTGNHEYYWDPEGLVEGMRKRKIQPLINENRLLDIGGARLMLAGVTDPVAQGALPSHRQDFSRAFYVEKSAVSPKIDFKILLSHRPDECDIAEKYGCDLQLSGHTHAGQFFPFNLIVRFVHRYYKGLNRHGKMWVYVNSGTGYWGPANRFAVDSEISLLTVTADGVAIV